MTSSLRGGGGVWGPMTRDDDGGWGGLASDDVIAQIAPQGKFWNYIIPNTWIPFRKCIFETQKHKKIRLRRGHFFMVILSYCYL